MNKIVSYRDLEIYQQAVRLAIEIHKMSMKLPKFELFEEGSQIRRSSKAVASAIVEGFGRRRYKKELVRFTVYAQTECDETKLHLEFLYRTGSLKDKDEYDHFYEEYSKLGKKIYRYLESVIQKHVEKRE